MKTTKIIIKNLFGITEQELDGSSIEITGTNGSGKTSVIDAIRYALTNDSEREFVIRQGESEGEILIETDSGLQINRKKRTNKADYKSIKSDGKDVPSPEAFLRELFTPLQLDPVAFTQMPKQEQNRVILDLIDFEWDVEWIQRQFGEVPPGVDYQQNILQVLNDIQAENGAYFQQRQDINREMRNKRAFIEDIAKDLPKDYQAQKWADYDLSSKYKELEAARHDNDLIDRAQRFLDDHDQKIRLIENERDMAVADAEKAASQKREELSTKIERLKAEITAAEKEIGSLKDNVAAAKKLADAQFNEGMAKLEKDLGVAQEYAGKKKKDISELESEVGMASDMIKHLNEYGRMRSMQDELDGLKADSDELTMKIELARTLPGEILRTATIPIKGFEVKDGIPLINGLPVSNLSEGEQLDLCVEVATANPNSLQIILIDGTEKLSDENRKRLYDKCKKRGLQFIATRTTNDNELEVTRL